MTIRVNQIKPDLSNYDIVFVPGGFGTRALRYDDEFVGWLKGAKDAEFLISVCTGSLLLGAAGFIANKKATTHPMAYATQADSMLDKYEFSRVRDELHPIDFTNAEKMILESLEKTMDHLHWVGHNVIYSALCLLAIRELGSWGTEDELIRIGQLIRSFEGTIPGRYGYFLEEPPI